MARKRAPISDYAHARDVARRLAGAGAEPFADDREQYLVLHGEREGEIIDLGRPLRAHRMFPVKSRSAAHRRATEFAAFAATQDQSAWRVWTLHFPARKTPINALVADLKQFNKTINSTFTQLRRDCCFELLILGLHIDFDRASEQFDLHAHLVAKVPDELVEKARRRLMTAFSRYHEEKLRWAYGFARYVAHAFKMAQVATWPTDALLAAWKLIDARPRYVRCGQPFTDWRKQEMLADKHRKEAARRKRENRKETRYTGNAWDNRDRPLVRRNWKIQGEDVLGTLFRSVRPMKQDPRTTAEKPRPKRYPSSFGATIQTPPVRYEQTNFGLAGVRTILADRVCRCNGTSSARVTPVRRSDMSDNYITKAEIHEAADRVDAGGAKPSPRSVRKLTDRGSYSTIEQHLASWQPKDQRATLPPTPEAFIAAVDLLRADLWFLALTYANETTAAQIAQATSEVAEARTTATAVGELADRLAAELATEKKRNSELRRLADERQQHIDNLNRALSELSVAVGNKQAKRKRTATNTNQVEHPAA